MLPVNCAAIQLLVDTNMSSTRQKPKRIAKSAKKKSAIKKRVVAKKSVKHATAKAAVTLIALIESSAKRLSKASLCFGHGSDNAFDEAAELAIFASGLSHQDAPAIYKKRLTKAQVDQTRKLVDRRIKTRLPAAYLTQRMWFCGHEFYVDERVLVPRSPIAELIEARFAPWIEAAKIKHVLDIGTGSGCIAIAAALALPQARVDAADVSSDALAVTQVNVERYSLQDRVRVVQSDVFDGLQGERYDLIVSNPPYVSEKEVRSLPKEYDHEPELGLVAGKDGLSIVRRILAQAEQHLSAQGVLIVEVGDTDDVLQAAYPRVPFIWLEFERGGGGVFVLTAEQLREYRKELQVLA
jgi:ribosomal protein L3 glutamine methyltransferase